jgi:Nuclease-related domain
MIMVLTALMLLAGAMLGGTVALVAAMLFGFTTALFVFVWLLGDVRALPWFWGAIGEQETARELKKLDPAQWTVDHDVERPRGGNWDHIVQGTRQTFMLETKHLGAQPVKIENDCLVSGRMRLRGAYLRAAALELKRERHLTSWVQAVVVIWGNFPQGVAEQERVVYVAGEQLVDWLESQP